VAQRARELAGAQQLGGAGVDHRGVEGLGQPLCDLLAHRVSLLAGQCPGRLDQVLDQAVAARGELTEPCSVAGHLRLP
jgi:hypothetical protein